MIQKVTWTRQGRCPAERGRVLPVPRRCRRPRRPTPSRSSRRTPTARSSTGPGRRAPTRPRRRSRPSSSLGGGQLSSTLAIVALVVGADRRRARRDRARRGGAVSASSREASRRARRGSLAVAGRARAAGGRVRARVPDPHGAVGERDPRELAAERRADLQRGGRAAVRDRSRSPTRAEPARAGADGAGRALAGDPNTLVVPLEAEAEGWYLVYWRVISVDGHPVRGAFTFAVGPNPGPAPQFPVPSISETAATPQLVVARWAVFLAVMTAIGLFVLRIAIVAARSRAASPGASLRAARDRVRGRRRGSALVAIPIYLLLATAAVRAPLGVRRSARSCRSCARRRSAAASSTSSSASRSSSLAAAVALWVDRPEREQRSVAELLAAGGALAAAAAVLLVPGVAGHAARDRAARALARARLAPPRGRLGLARRPDRPARARGRRCRPRGASPGSPSRCRGSRTSRSSRCCVLLGSGIGATVVHLPTLAALWETSYGKTDPRQDRAARGRRSRSPRSTCCGRSRARRRERDAELGASAALLLRRLVGGEAILVAAAVLGGALLSSLPPPAKALAKESRRARPGRPGRGRDDGRRQDGYTLGSWSRRTAPRSPNAFALEIDEERQAGHAAPT